GSGGITKCGKVAAYNCPRLAINTKRVINASARYSIAEQHRPLTPNFENRTSYISDPPTKSTITAAIDVRSTLKEPSLCYLLKTARTLGRCTRQQPRLRLWHVCVVRELLGSKIERHRKPRTMALRICATDTVQHAKHPYSKYTKCSMA